MLSNSPLGKHAVVLGGSMTGLLAARVLTEYFERVSVVERDHYPADPIFRPGVPQARHPHLLLLRGQQILEELFPGIRQDLITRGAIDCDFINDYPFRAPSGWLSRSPSQLRVYVSTRPLLEWQVRQALVKNPQIQIIDGHAVLNLVASEDAKSIIGVSLRARPHSGGQAQGVVPTGGQGQGTILTDGQAQDTVSTVVADLVVDATGRDSKAPQWLKSLGYVPPSETTINPFLGYATRLCDLPADPRRDWKGLIIQSDPPRNLRSGALWPTEDGHWMVLLIGAGKEYPPTDEDAFLEFARGLPDLAMFEVIKDAQPLSPIYGYRQTENRIRHFERLQRQPERFLVIGDAACSFNPIYAQGMTTAALGAMTLRECLRQCSHGGLSGLPHRFQRKLARVNASSWTLATATDIRIPGAEGGSINWINKWQYDYLDRFLRLLPKDDYLTARFFKVLHMIEAPNVFFHPVTAIKVFFTRK